MKKKKNTVDDLTDITLESILHEIGFLRKAYKGHFKQAMANHEWSKLAGFDGIETGLFIAQRVIEKKLHECS